jgi:predicted nucleic acid-binding protein
MILYLLYTTLLAGYLNGRSFATDLVAPWIEKREVATSIIAYAEVFEYLRGRANFTARYNELRGLMLAITPIFVGRVEAERYADIRRGLRPPYGPGLIGDMDTLIAATAIVHDLVLVTTDSDFLRVPDLQAQHVTLQR